MQSNDRSIAKHIKVFYDGDCPLCNKEIKIYQKADISSKFLWIDINREPDALKRYALDYVETQKIFHVIDTHGKLQKGVDGFLVIWRELKYWRILYWLVRLPVIKQLADIAYHYFAKWRFKKNCQTCN